jgi:hypothetical protein
MRFFIEKIYLSLEILKFRMNDKKLMRDIEIELLYKIFTKIFFFIKN